MAVASFAIVEHLDVLEEIGPSILAGSVDLLPHSLLLQAAEKRLADLRAQPPR
jgi:hypothetical protein